MIRLLRMTFLAAMLIGTLHFPTRISTPNTADVPGYADDGEPGSLLLLGTALILGARHASRIMQRAPRERR